MERLNAAMAPAPVRPVKVLQFGEGNFLRAFVDYMIDIANEKSDFNGSVALVKPIQMGTLFPAFKEQDYRYTVMLRGLVDGQAVEQTRVVTSVSDAVDAICGLCPLCRLTPKLPSLQPSSSATRPKPASCWTRRTSSPSARPSPTPAS